MDKGKGILERIRECPVFIKKCLFFIKKCPVFLLLVVSGLLFTAVGIAGRFSLYGGYEWNPWNRPFLALMMEGLDQGVTPLDVCGAVWPVWNGTDAAAATARGEGQSLDGFAEAETVSEERLDTAGETVEDTETASAADGAVQGAEAVNPEDAIVAGQAAEADETVTYDFQAVTEDYFNDAVFIGDSRTVGLFEYGGLEERADFFAKISLTIYDVFTAPVAEDEETGEKITVEDALEKKQYGKVYLMLGINELGTGNTEYFMDHYTAAVEKIRQLQPDAVIFVQGIMRVTGEKDESDPIFNNTNINEKNEAIATLADNRNIFYIDVNEVVCDENGNLVHEYTIDEIHLKAKYYEIWKQFLLEHGIVKG